MTLVPPHGDVLVDLQVDTDRAAAIKAESRTWPSWNQTPRQLCDLELLVTGGFSPLRGFLTRGDYEAVCAAERLAGGLVWPIPVVLDVPEAVARTLDAGRPLALRDPEGVLLAVLHVEEVWQSDRQAEALAVYGTSSLEHPGVAALMERTHPWYVGGRLEAVQRPIHYDFRALRRTPAELRAAFAEAGWTQVVAFQTRNPMHRAHVELTRRAAREADAGLLIQPVVGMTKPGDVDHYTRVRCYQAILPGYAAGRVTLALLPLAMRMAGPREAVWHGHHPEEPRLRALHRRARPRRSRPGRERPAILRPLRCPGAAAAGGRRARCPDGAVPGDGLRRQSRSVCSGRRGAGRRAS